MNTQKEEYITLFCEGDGSVGITSDGYPRIDFDQKERDVLDYIASLVGRGQPRQNKMGAWKLVFSGKYCIPLLETFSRHVVGKKFLDRLDKVLEHVDMPLATQHPLTLDGFIGFWDAEGSSSNKPTIEVSQKDREILDLITAMFGGSVLRARTQNGGWSHLWQLCREKARSLYKIILERSHCPAKAERLRKNFEEDRGKTQKKYDDTHKDEKKVHNNAYYARQKATRDWMKAHPEEVTKLLERSQST